MVNRANEHDVSSRWVPLTGFIGREAEIAAVRARLADDDVRLLTLLGPGGSGKTRLAIEIARRGRMEDNTEIVFADLSSVRDAAGMTPALIEALGVSEESDPSDQIVINELRRRAPLLVLDNLEQIEGVAAPVGELLRSCPGLTILGTSRSPVRVSGEQRWPIDPFPLPLSSGYEEAPLNPA